MSVCCSWAACVTAEVSKYVRSFAWILAPIAINHRTAWRFPSFPALDNEDMVWNVRIVASFCTAAFNESFVVLGSSARSSAR